MKQAARPQRTRSLLERLSFRPFIRRPKSAFSLSLSFPSFTFPGRRMNERAKRAEEGGREGGRKGGLPPAPLPRAEGNIQKHYKVHQSCARDELITI